jgi:hypothetical protein
MKQQVIYQVEIIPIGTINDLRKKETFSVFFSNLSKTIENLQNQLALNGWELNGLNYSAVYRHLQIKDKFWLDYNIASNKVFRVQITKHILNPVITTMGIEEKPILKKK